MPPLTVTSGNAAVSGSASEQKGRMNTVKSEWLANCCARQYRAWSSPWFAARRSLLLHNRRKSVSDSVLVTDFGGVSPFRTRCEVRTRAWQTEERCRDDSIHSILVHESGKCVTSRVKNDLVRLGVLMDLVSYNAPKIVFA